MSEKPLQLDHDAIHLGSQGAAVPVTPFENDYERYLAAHCTVADPGRLVSLGTSTKDWPVWEIHPAGAEVVIVVSGKAEFIQDFDGAMKHTIVGPNEAIINPPGVLELASVSAPSQHSRNGSRSSLVVTVSVIAPPLREVSSPSRSSSSAAVRRGDFGCGCFPIPRSSRGRPSTPTCSLRRSVALRICPRA